MGCPGADVFHELVAGTLPHGERETLADHAGSCDECRAVLGALFDVEPERIDRYTIAKRIGAGAMGTVYEAHDPELDRKVAIKVLRGAGSAERLRREAQMLAKLHHPNVVAVHDAGEHEGRTFVAMALVDGETLRAWMGREHTVDEIVRVIRDAGRGLAAAHAAGVIHRDLKPDNIFIARDGSVLVGDFGLAFVDGERGEASSGDGPVELTQTGMVLGTPAYMAPEHAAGAPTAASDQFSLCVTAWEALYGARPFAGATFAEVQQAIANGEPVEGKRAVPARIRAALERGLRAKPEDRWSSLAELDAALAPPRRRWPWIAAAVVVIAAASAFVWSATRGPSCEFSLANLHLGSAAASYEHDWVALRSEVCHTPRPNDARLRCLERAREALKDLAAQMGSSEPDLVHRAIGSLPHIAACRDALDNEIDPAKLVKGEAQLAQIVGAEVRVQMSGGGKLDELERLDGPVAALDYEPAVVALAIAEGSTMSRVGRNDDAARAMRAALGRAEAAHDDRAVASLVAELAPVSIRMHKLDEAATLLALGDAAYVRAGHDTETELQLASAHAGLAAELGDHDRAIAIARDTLAKVKARPGDTVREQYLLTYLLVEQLSFAGRLKEAAEESREAQRLEAGLGFGSALDIVTIEREFNEAFMQGDVERSIELAKQGVTLTESLNDPKLQAETTDSLARAYDLARDFPRVIAAQQHVIELCGQTCTAEQRSQALEDIANSYLELGEPEKALEPARGAVEAAAAGGKPLDDTRWRAVTALARALLRTGHAHDARGALEPVMHEIESATNVIPGRRAGVEITLAQALWEDGGEPERARARALAGDAEKDYGAQLEVIKAYPAVMQVGMKKHVAETIEWRKRH
ncbi:MAG TPA: serine/threonine-protein kinase [Kofleriaceae bacterium]